MKLKEENTREIVKNGWNKIFGKIDKTRKIEGSEDLNLINPDFINILFLIKGKTKIR